MIAAYDIRGVTTGFGLRLPCARLPRCSHSPGPRATPAALPCLARPSELRARSATAELEQALLPLAHRAAVPRAHVGPASVRSVRDGSAGGSDGATKQHEAAATAPRRAMVFRSCGSCRRSLASCSAPALSASSTGMSDHGYRQNVSTPISFDGCGSGGGSRSARPGSSKAAARRQP